MLRYDGSARALGDGELLYNETHYLERSGGRLQQRLVLYRCPQGGAVFARKQVRYGMATAQPAFELEDARFGYREGLRRDAGQNLSAFVQRERDQAEEQASIAATPALVADAGFDEFLTQNWDALRNDEALRLEFLIPAQLKTLNFKIQQHHAERIAGRDTMVIRLSLGAWWGFIAPHIDAAYDRETRALLRYQGPSNLRNENGRNLNVQVDFPPARRRASDLASLMRAGHETLVSSCTAATNSPQAASP